MKHFKSGADVVVVEAIADFRVGDTHTIDYVDGYGRVWLDCGGWLQAKRLRLVEQDDPLPPAPESVLYIGMQDYYRALRVGRHDGGGVLDLHIGGGVLGDGKSCILDPDSALQLAHDLTRMAMEIKRKEKQQRKTTLSPAIAHPYGE